MAKQSGKSKKKAAPKGKEQTAKAADKPGKDKGKLGNKEYAKELRKLHVELVKMQEWVKHAGLKVCIVFEGRDTAGKGGTIKAITERVSPRTFRVIALPAPSDREKSQMYVQRYLPHLPAAGEVVIFDRSYYNRAGLSAMPDIDSATTSAGFERGPVHELPYNQHTRHYGLALDYIFTE